LHNLYNLISVTNCKQIKPT